MVKQAILCHFDERMGWDEFDKLQKNWNAFARIVFKGGLPREYRQAFNQGYGDASGESKVYLAHLGILFYDVARSTGLFEE